MRKPKTYTIPIYDSKGFVVGKKTLDEYEYQDYLRDIYSGSPEVSNSRAITVSMSSFPRSM